MGSDDITRAYLGRMAPLQEAYTENVNGLNEIKADARADGLNLDAVNALLPLLAKYPHDKGAMVINELIRYAEAYGTEGLVARGAGATQAPAPVEAELAPPPPAPAPAVQTRGPGGARLRAGTQLAAALGVAFGLLWLLN